MKKTCGNCKIAEHTSGASFCPIEKMQISEDEKACEKWSEIRLCPFCHKMPTIETEFSFKSARMFKDGYVVKCNCGLKTKPFKTQKALKKYWNGETASV